MTTNGRGNSPTTTTWGAKQPPATSTTAHAVHQQATRALVTCQATARSRVQAPEYLQQRANTARHHTPLRGGRPRTPTAYLGPCSDVQQRAMPERRLAWDDQPTRQSAAARRRQCTTTTTLRQRTVTHNNQGNQGAPAALPSPLLTSGGRPAAYQCAKTHTADHGNCTTTQCRT
jgi:hypothetical protein